MKKKKGVMRTDGDEIVSESNKMWTKAKIHFTQFEFVFKPWRFIENCSQTKSKVTETTWSV